MSAALGSLKCWLGPKADTWVWLQAQPSLHPHPPFLKNSVLQRIRIQCKKKKSSSVGPFFPCWEGVQVTHSAPPLVCPYNAVSVQISGALTRLVTFPEEYGRVLLGPNQVTSGGGSARTTQVRLTLPPATADDPCTDRMVGGSAKQT